MTLFDPSYDTPIQIQQPVIGSPTTQVMVVGTEGTLSVDGTFILGGITIPAPPTPGTTTVYRLQVTSGGVASWVTP